MDQTELADLYLSRLGLDRPKRCDALALRTLQARHLQRVPFENLDIHLGVPISLDLEALADKVLRRRRGGFCYELNGLFAELLVSLGYRVTLLAARVWGGQEFGPPLDHLALCVGCVDDATTWLVDVGFGAHSLYPLRLEPHLDQADPGGIFRIEPAGERDLDVLRDGVVQYRLEAHPRVLSEFEAMCWYQQTSPRSHFVQMTVCTIQTERGRITLSDDRLIRTEGETRREMILADDDAVLDTYVTIFGMELDRVPRVQNR